jgi:ADP-ribose pyrophosphatase YjhB (NUDIX family)
MRRCGLHKLVADVAVVASGRVLFVRYRDTSSYDGQEGWFLPDDYLDHLEHPDGAARRILREQVGIEAVDVRLTEIESFGNGAWHLVFHYKAEVELPEAATGDNIEAAEWFPLDALPPADEVAHHGWGLEVLDRVLKPV